MASGDVIFEVNNVAVSSDDIERTPNGSGASFALSTVLSTNVSANTSPTSTLVTTPASGVSHTSTHFTLGKSITSGGAVGVKTLFDGTKLYKITVTEV